LSKTAFLFSGQGAQFVGMGKGLYETSDIAKSMYDFADSKTEGRVTKFSFEGPEDVLKQTINNQPCMLTYEAVLLTLASEKGIKADMTAGFSLGEFGAMICAEVLSFEDCLTLINERAKLMNEAAQTQNGKMAAILGGDPSLLIETCKNLDGYVEPVNFNCPGQTVIAGDHDTIDEAIEKLTESGFHCIPLSVNGAFHSRHMDSAAQEISKVAAAMTFRAPKIPLLSNVSGQPETDFQRLVSVQMASPVLWEKSIRYMIEQGVTRFVEIGPGKVLVNFMKKIDRSVEAVHITSLLGIEV